MKTKQNDPSKVLNFRGMTVISALPILIPVLIIFLAVQVTILVTGTVNNKEMDLAEERSKLEQKQALNT